MDDAVMTSCLHTFCRECILHVFGQSRRAACPLCRTVVARADLTTLPKSSRFNINLDDPAACHSSAKIDALISELRAGFEQEEGERAAAAAAAAAAATIATAATAPTAPTAAAAFADPHSLADLAASPPNGVTSAAAAGLSGPPTGIIPERRPLKCVIFSQWNGMLDLVEAAIRRELGVRTVRLDGSLSLDKRRGVLAAFRDEPGMRIMLLSLRAGNVGLNLTAAQKVYLLDPW
jgi:DNA repair protein RAD5